MFHVVRKTKSYSYDKDERSRTVADSDVKTFEEADEMAKKLAVENAHHCIVSGPANTAPGTYVFFTSNMTRVTHKAEKIA